MIPAEIKTKVFRYLVLEIEDQFETSKKFKMFLELVQKTKQKKTSDVFLYIEAYHFYKFTF